MDERSVYQVIIFGKTEPEETYSERGEVIAHADSLAQLDQFSCTVDVVEIKMGPNPVGSAQRLVIHRVKG